MIILDVEVVAPGSEVGSRIGNPQSWTPESQNPAAPCGPTNGSAVNAPAPTPSNNPPPAPSRPPPSRPSPQKPAVPSSSANSGGRIEIIIRFNYLQHLTL